MIRQGLPAALFLACLLAAGTAGADQLRPGILDIRETQPGWFQVTWKLPLVGGRMPPLTPRLPAALEPVGPPTRRQTPVAIIESASFRLEGGSLLGATISIEGTEAVATDVILQLHLADGTHHSTVLRPHAPSFTVPARPSAWEVAASYWQMGTIHILEGIDHLLFVLALLIIVATTLDLLKAVTAFTVAHSITLSLATLDLLTLPSAPTEAVIALSIVFLAGEIVHKQRGQAGLTERYPWIVAFAFGLFHGLGFAGALAEIGVPADAVPLALLTFNLGVETGQLLFIAVVLAALWLLRRLPQVAWQAPAVRTVPYAIGGLAAFWTLERTAASLGVAM